MKRLFFVFLAVTAFLLASCSKDAPSKKFTDEIKGSVWTGEMRYDGRTLNEPYSLYFDENGNIEWNEWSGTYAGTYTVNDDTRSINITFASGSNFSVTVSENNTFTDFEYGAIYNYDVLSGQLYTEGEVELTGTWPPANSATHGVVFNGPSTLQITNLPTEYVYARRHGTIRFGFAPDWYFFGVITKTSIKGIYSFSGGPSGVSFAVWHANNL